MKNKNLYKSAFTHRNGEIQFTNKGLHLINLVEDYNNTGKIKVFKRYKLIKEIRSLTDPVHLTGVYSILYTIIFK